VRAVWESARAVAASPPDPDAVASALAATWARLAETLEQGWAREIGRTTALLTGLPVPTLNGVWAPHADAAVEDMETGLDAVAAEGVGHCLQVRPSLAGDAGALAERRGLALAEEIPLMAVAGPVEAPAAGGLAIRELAPEEARLHCEIAAPAFGAPVDLLAGLITPGVLGLPEVRGYLVEAGGEAVGTAMSVTIAGGVGIFNVATPPEHRRRGYGSAATARASADGLAAGASWSWLQATEAGYGVYEALGFVTLERWPCWITA
jgi:ribosomal protein S18 acetylase RimI-like enzyme